MTAVTVFVDEAVRGDLPSLCAVSGRPTDSAVVIKHRAGGVPAAAVLLLLLGPVGLVVLLVLAVVLRRETLVVEIPLHHDEVIRWRWLVVVQAGLLGSGLAALGVSFAFAGAGQSPVWLVVTVGCVVAAALANLAARSHQVGVALDASGRWVTLSRVHPDFADSYRRSRSDARVSASAGDLSGR